MTQLRGLYRELGFTMTGPNKKKIKNIEIFKASKVVWVGRVILVACLLLLLLEIYLCVEKYLERATTLNVEIKNMDKVQFPQVTICPDVKEGYKPDRLRIHNTTRGAIMSGKMGNMTWEQFLDVTYEPEEIIHLIQIKTYTDAKYHHIWNNDSKQFRKIVKPTLERRYGRCATITVPKDLRVKGFQNIIVQSKRGFNAFVHHENQYQYGSHPKVYTSTNNSLFIDINYEVLKFIPGNDCSTTMDWTYDNCFRESSIKEMLDTKQCVLPYFWPRDGNLTKMPLCQGDNPNMMKQYAISNIQEECLNPCEILSISFGFPFQRESMEPSEVGKAQVMFKVSRSVQVKTMVYSYTPLSLVAEIGGYSGLLLGISALDLSRLALRHF